MEASPSHTGRLRGQISRGHSGSSLSSRSELDSPTMSSSSASFGTAAAVSQSLSSILNNPHAGRSDASWSLWWPSGSSVAPDLTTPITLSVPLPEVTRSDFQPYITSISDAYSRFEDVVQHSTNETAAATTGNLEGEVRGQGEALVACLREVPSMFFKGDFALEDGATFHAACPFLPSAEENLALQERLTHYLDVVEMHLVREISLRSDSFFEAQGQLQGLNEEIVVACVRIRELKDTIRILSGDLAGSAKQMQELNATRGNLVTLHQKLAVILYVSQALGALKLLVAAADCAGALDVIDDLQHLLDTDELVGLHCFRHLRDQLAGSLDAINNILSAEFLRAAIHDAKAVDSAILSKLRKGPADLTNGVATEFKLDDDESSILRDRLLPLVVGLIKTAKLPVTLKSYRDTLIADMKSAIKTTVAELLPVLLARPMESEQAAGERAMDAEGGGLSLASKLRSLSSEGFVQLLAAIFKVVQAHLTQAAEVKGVIEWIMGNIDGCYAADSVAVAVAHGAAVAAAAEVAQDGDTTSGSHISHSHSRNPPKITLFQGRTNDSSSPVTSRNFRADISRENTEAIFAACDAAHQRWAKLLGVRALIHPKLRYQEFLSIYDITQDFITATEKIGGRLGYSIRGTLQSQSKAFVDFQHESRMTKIKAVLDQETWVEVDVPEEFQAIVMSLYSGDGPFTNGDIASNHPASEMVEHGDLSEREHVRLDNSVKHTTDQINSQASSIRNQEVQSESTSTKNDVSNNNEHGRSSSQTLIYGGVGYHMVNCGLILLKMLSEYVDVSKSLPALSPEVVHRVVELLKLFNSRTCQLVLGAGAMQVSGLKSITSKHLALASQIISLIYTIILDIRRVLFSKIPESRKALLMSEIDRVAQDYKIHRDEIHTKLIQIMRERLLANLRKLPQIVESWNGPEENDSQASQFARSVTKQVTFLHQILSQILLEVDVQAIFRQVVQNFHSHITDAFSKLEFNTPQANNRLCRDVQHILACIRKLPSDNLNRDGIPNHGQLDKFLEDKFGVRVGTHTTS